MGHDQVAQTTQGTIRIPLRNPYAVQTTIRPLKVAYFFPEGDLSALERIVNLCATQWGGIGALLIPWGPTGVSAVSARYLRMHDPDLFVGFFDRGSEVGESQWNGAQAFLLTTWRERVLHLQEGVIFEQHDDIPHPLTIVPRRHLRKLRVKVRKFEASGLERTILLALFGSIPEHHVADYSERVGLDEVPTVLDHTALRDQVDDRVSASPLNLTAWGISTVSGSQLVQFTSHFDVHVVDDVETLCAFWNSRATRLLCDPRRDKIRRTLLLPKSWLGDVQALRELAEVVHNNEYHELDHVDAAVWIEPLPGYSIPEIRAALLREPAFCELTGIIRGQLFASRERPAPAPPPAASIGVRFSSPIWPPKVHGGLRSETSVSVQLTEGSVAAFYQPAPRKVLFGNGNVAVDLKSSVWDRLPRSDRVGSLVVPNGRRSVHGITHIRRGTGPIDLRISQPNEWRALATHFEQFGFGIRLSISGRYASAMLQLPGGFDQLTFLRSQLSYRLLDVLAVRSSLRLAQRIAKILGVPDADTAAIERAVAEAEISDTLVRPPHSYLELSSALQCKASDVGLQTCVHAMLASRLVRRGYTIECDNCGSVSWHTLESIAEDVTCPGCNARSLLPLTRGDQLLQWSFRLNALVNRVMDQDALPHLLALLFFTATAQGEIGCLVPGLELLGNDGNVVAEFDALFVEKGALVACECKSGSTLTAKDIATARRAIELGFSKFAFATVRQFDAASLALVDGIRDEAARAAVKIEVLDGSKLLDAPVQ